MKESSHIWTIVLAAGEGTRLRDLTTDSSGAPVPKQYWRIDDDMTMLQWTLDRAARLSGFGHVVPIVAAGHRRHWEIDLARIPSRNIVVQPRNRGTAAGILLPLNNVLRRDPQATVIVMPSDHFVSDERVLEDSIHRAVAATTEEPDHVVLLGITPDRADSELGYILPAAGTRPARGVHAFVEKPEPELARELLDRGALWNSFIFVAKGAALSRLFDRTQKDLLEAFRLDEEEIEAPPYRLDTFDDEMLARRLDSIYDEIPARDFSRDVLQRVPGSLRVVVVPRCGWTDLGTPARVRHWRQSNTMRPLSRSLTAAAPPMRVAVGS